MHIEIPEVRDKGAEQDRLGRALTMALNRPKQDDWLLAKVQEYQRKQKAEQELVNRIKREVLLELGVPFKE